MEETLSPTQLMKAHASLAALLVTESDIALRLLRRRGLPANHTEFLRGKLAMMELMKDHIRSVDSVTKVDQDDPPPLIDVYV
ncbi:hypothetical protein [Chitinimonas sp. BJB300]|uniref:hypothetical protein n=1 Tax=Chitinimonas sp. BJB300 TaxID=1559339 RepID=UPI000C0E90C8|nr:hypothetical protein [Chitinimonas sp. BJB300]PHV09522.1 hypothetical protein CSQ89_21305 [Chitinimonas sp. BJB300]TSJ82559.1 hypothetical protein FG002_022120 [Chitinimonas sp. BJB300]TSJ83894.1 hypothetical protein FG002_020415 [Chitinimonas sp. BJB300]